MLSKPSAAGAAPPVRCWDDVFRRPFARKRFAPELPAAGAAAALVETWERWAGAGQPALLRAGELDLEEGLLTREWVAGFSLLEWLRHRRKLRAAEALPLAGAAAAILDEAAGHGLLAGYGLDKLFVAFPTVEDEAARALKSVPLAGWPPWSLRLEPLRLGSLLATPTEITKPAARLYTADATPAVAACLRILRELLGGARTPPGVPLATLNAEANAMLASAAQKFSTARELACALALAAGIPDFPPLPPRRAEYIVPGGFDPADEATLLRLDALHDSARSLRLVAREEIRFGRSSVHADVVARFAKKLPGANELAKAIGRLHLRAQSQAEGLVLLDGSAGHPSRNGSFTSEGPVSTDTGTPLRGPTVVQLGALWRATFLPAPAPAELVALRTHEETAGRHAPAMPAPARWGALFLRPWRDCEVRLETVWLLEEAGFGLDDAGDLVWDITALDTAPAAFRKSGGGLALINRRLESAEFSVDERPLAPGTALPLRAGMVLKIGRGVWSVSQR